MSIEELSMMGKSHEELIEALTESRHTLLRLMEDAPWFWRRPTPESWSGAEVVEHVARTEDSVARVLRRLSRMAAGEQLPPVTIIPGTFREGKPQAPPSVQPVGGISYLALRELLETTRAKLRNEIRSFILSTSYTFPHPFLGELTGLQWIQMTVFHERHHIQQLIRCRDALRT
ncbi:MAG: DinB family protein [Bacteroidia bacterium]|nr:DinB family protein [Bacteroidia bacterium]